MRRVGSDPQYGCPETYNGRHSTADRQGRCYYCKIKFEGKHPRSSREFWHSRDPLDDAYRRTYDPDWGSGPYDQDPN